MLRITKTLLVLGSLLVAATGSIAQAAAPFDLTLSGPSTFLPGQTHSGPFTGTLRAAGVGVPNQTIEVSVDGQPTATAATTFQGTYAVSLPPFSGTATRTVRATAFGGTPLETTASMLVEVVRYPLTVVLSGSQTGSVTSNPGGISCGVDCSSEFAATSIVELSVDTPPSLVFVGWSGGGCAGTGACSVTLNGATTVTATFALQTQRLTVSRSGPGTGTVFSSPAGINCGADCVENYTAGTVVNLTAAPAPNSTFTGWSGGGCGGTGVCAVTMNADKTVIATFSLMPVTLTVARAGTGFGTVVSTPSGITCGGDCSEAYNVGTTVTLSAFTSSGSVFVGWSGGGCSGTGTCNVTMFSATTVTAMFNVAQYTLSVARGGSGSGTVTSSPGGINCGADCSEVYAGGTVVTLTATASFGSSFVGWSGAGCSGTGPCTVTMNASMTVGATFS